MSVSVLLGNHPQPFQLSRVDNPGRQRSALGTLSIYGVVIGILSLRLMPWIVHLAGLAGMILGVVLELLLAGYLWPGMPYERVLSYLLGAGLAGMVSAGLIALIVLKHRANQQM
ncbi:hypothetical protein ALQ70_100832 [Pseudomonas savastanoi pv. glycinea]|nr:hypothetical protein ALQ70_100832 [Pseudomonas savastanoi pv. glycinea]